MLISELPHTTLSCADCTIQHFLQSEFYVIFSGVFSVLTILCHKTSYFLSNIMRSECYGATYVSLFRSSFISILKCAIFTPKVHFVLYSLSALDCSTGPGHVLNDQLIQLDKTQYMLLLLFQYMEIPARWNQVTLSIGYKY